MLVTGTDLIVMARGVYWEVVGKGQGCSRMVYHYIQ